MPPAFYRGDSGKERFTFRAPKQPGIYYITHRFTLDFYCKENAREHTNNIADALAVIRVMPAENKPAAQVVELGAAPILPDDEPEQYAYFQAAPQFYTPYEPLRFQNACEPQHYIHVQTLEPQAGEIQKGWWSAQWEIEPVEDVMPYVRLKNKWTGGYLNVEEYTLAQGEIDPGWWSAMWELEPVEDTEFVRIKNRWIEGYLHNGSGQLELGEVAPGQECGWWLIEKI